ncbi:hypothetical protein [Paenarthrobacter nitroguajacolicus]|uniref:hypothetical protein n=1 Tax=Paenarthrobacter nitroguajacolicus TaxID=211146 RepID=UPI0028611E70|nr:hypothetical protein [Paenarthrobacter nitroguajacolicus]MDR6637733.1 hypothetical protein [Paenarthrobacter nitroguajacolicus]
MSEEPLPASPDPPATKADLPPGVRAQLLATEHWSLLASRSTTQGEVLTRISMFLTFTSASLLSVALVGNATQFSDAFRAFALTILSIDVVVGLLTHVRVMSVGMEDLMYVIAMNRLRAAYVDLDPGVAPYLMASFHDDEEGAKRTYYFFGGRRDFSQVAGSSMVFMGTVNSALIALLLGSAMLVGGLPVALSVGIAVVAALAFFVTSLARGHRRYLEVWKNNPPVSRSSEKGPSRSQP